MGYAELPPAVPQILSRVVPRSRSWHRFHLPGSFVHFLAGWSSFFGEREPLAPCMRGFIVSLTVGTANAVGFCVELEIGIQKLELFHLNSWKQITIQYWT